MSDKKVLPGGDEVETIVGPSVKVEGEFVSEGNIVIEGQVSGTVKTGKHLRVEEGAKINANVGAESALVSGEVHGNMKIGSTLELTPTAKIYGDVETKTIIVAAGAILHGRCIMDENEKGRKVKGKNEGYDENAPNS
ncbi:MAG: polymer-forming cytoskeletal protein [Patescibacteria group bacterium]